MKKSESKPIDKLYKQAVENFKDELTIVSNEHELLILRIFPNERCPRIFLITDDESKIPHDSLAKLLHVASHLIESDTNEIFYPDTDPDSYKIQVIYDVKYNWFQDIYRIYLKSISDMSIFYRWMKKIENETTYGLTIEIASYLS